MTIDWLLTGALSDLQTAEFLNLIDRLPSESLFPFVEKLSQLVSTVEAARIAAIFSARVERDLEEGKA